jgi:hypothetical protein
MKSILSCFLAGCLIMLYAKTTAWAAVPTFVHPGVTGDKITLDRLCMEQAWQNADSVYEFVQSEPHEDSAVSERSVVKVVIADGYLCVGFRCFYSKPDQVVAQLKNRDDAVADRVTVYLSGRNDNETGYMFRVNAAGVQADACLSSDGRQAEYSWDGVWYSAVNKDATGWTAEFKIPFKTMRYLSGAKWKIGFARYIACRNEYDYWPPIKVQQGLRISGLADLLGAEPARPGLNLEVYPVGRITYDRIAEKRYMANGGLDLSWLPSPAGRLDITGNPDFAQIESDPDRINLSRYENYFDEKRPFFTEGAENFKTPIELFYSRRIGKRLPDGKEVPIYGAGKYQGRYGRYDVSMLCAVCGKVDYTDGYGSRLTESHSTYPVIRINKNVGNNSSIGIFCASKENDSSYNRLYSIDGVLRKRELEWSNQLAISQSRRTKEGLAYKSSFNWNSRTYLIMASSEKYGAQFSANEIGYVTYNGESHQIITGPVWMQKGIFQSVYVLGGWSWSMVDGDPGYSKVGLININPNFRKWGLSTNVNYGRQHEMDKWYNNWYYALSFWPNGDRKWNIKPQFSYTNWAYNYRRGYFGPNGSVNIMVSYSLRSNIEISWQGNNTIEWRQDKTYEKSSWIHEFWFSWSLTRDFHFKTYYNPNWETHYHKVNVLLSYNIAPKSWLYLAYNEGADDSTGHPKTKERVVSLKLSRLFWW